MRQEVTRYTLAAVVTLLLIGRFAPAKADGTISVFGIPLGKPLILPACPKKPELFEIKSPITCRYPISDSTNLYLENPPPAIKSIHGVSHNGILDTMYVWTYGLAFQDTILSLLKDRFGEPTLFEKVPYQNAYGTRFIGYHAIWNNSLVHVDFDAAFSRKSPDPEDQGRISIQTKTAHDNEIKKLEKDSKRQGKF